jgi:hypothetical protein
LTRGEVPYTIMNRCICRINTVRTRIVLSVLLFTAAGQIALPCAEGKYHFVSPELIYTDEQMTEMELADGIGIKNGYNPFVDQSFWAVKQRNGKMRFYYRSMLHQSFHEGLLSDRSFFGNTVFSISYLKGYTDSPKNPMKNRMKHVAWPRGFKPPFLRLPSDQVEFIPNVYAVSEKELLGFVHIERCARGIMIDPLHPEQVIDRLYAVGLAWSENGGRTWIYCGDIVLPYWDSDGDTLVYSKHESGPAFSNIGGVPYIIATDGTTGIQMLQVYFNEKTDKKSPLYPAAARAPLDSVLMHARKGDVGESFWKKRAFPAWTADAFHELGGRCLPTEPDGWNYDTHSDAAFCRTTGEYLLTINASDYSGYPDTVVYSLLLFSSIDGEEWHLKKTLDTSTDYQPVYSSFISEADDAAIDDHIVGNDFYILYARRPVINGRVDGTHADLYAIGVEAEEN